MAAGDISGMVTTSVSDLKPELLLVGAAGIALGAVQFGARRAWGFFKGIAK